MSVKLRERHRFQVAQVAPNKDHSGDYVMAIKDPKELFVALLSNLRQGTERTTNIFQELSQVAQNPDVKEALEARVFVSQQILEKLDQCFKLIGEKPVQFSGRLQEVFVEDFR